MAGAEVLSDSGLGFSCFYLLVSLSDLCGAEGFLSSLVLVCFFRQGNTLSRIWGIQGRLVMPFQSFRLG